VTETDLISMGITILGKRKKIESRIKTLNGELLSKKRHNEEALYCKKKFKQTSKYGFAFLNAWII